jgi:hypothetical protein
MEVELSFLSIAIGLGLALGSKLVVEPTEATLGSKDPIAIGRSDMVAREKVSAFETGFALHNDRNWIRTQIWPQILQFLPYLDMLRPA